MNLTWQQQVIGSSVGWWLQPCMPTRVRYTGPLEYLTMWMCLFLSPAVLERMRDLQAQEPEWTRLRGIRVKLSAAQAIHPHVLDVLQHMGSAPNDAACPILPLMQKAT